MGPVLGSPQFCFFQSGGDGKALSTPLSSSLIWDHPHLPVHGLNQRWWCPSIRRHSVLVDKTLVSGPPLFPQDRSPLCVINSEWGSVRLR